jgi:hypothetical protein
MAGKEPMSKYLAAVLIVRIGEASEVEKEIIAGFFAKSVQSRFQLVRIRASTVEEGENLRAGRQVLEKSATDSTFPRLIRTLARERRLLPVDKDDIVRHRVFLP